jgi:sphingolipid 4-desaturase/C4-monooxygenase
MRRDVLRHAPGAARLIGPNPWTALAIPLLFTLHWGMALLVGGTSVLLCFMAAFFFGQIVMHATGALLHETAHRLVFQQRLPKLLFDLSLESIFGSFGKQLTYQHQHISSHHPFTGNYERDYEHEDICSFNARRTLAAANPALQRGVTIATLMLHLLPFGFLLADLLVSRIYRNLTGLDVKDHARDIGDTKPERLERNLCIAVSLIANFGLISLFGFYGWLYHNWSLSLFLGKFGITNLGQSLSEHDGDDEVNPTYSDYRPLNWILFNTGYHNEHHTFPTVPWNRLPRLKQLAPKVFNRENPRNYLSLWWAHVSRDFSPSRRNPLMKQDLAARCSSVRASKQ